MTRWLHRLLRTARQGNVAAKRLAGPAGSRRRRRLTILAPLVVLLVVPTLVLAIDLPPQGTTGATGPAPQFEVDGNKMSQGSTTLDWADGSPSNGTVNGVIIGGARVTSGANSGTCTQTNSQSLGGPGVVGGGVLVCDGSVATDKPLNNADHNYTSGSILGGGGFVQGQHEEESPDKASPAGSTTALWNISNASSPKKSDLAEVMAYAKVGDSAYDTDIDNDDLFFFFDATRLDINGDFHVDFELNQNARTGCGDADATTFCQKRVANDVLVSFDTTVSGDLVTSVYRYTESNPASCATTSAGIGVPPGCYVLQTSPPSPPGGGTQPASFALFNSTEIDSPPWQSAGCDPVSGDNKPGCKLRTKMPAGGDMEGYIDLSAFITNFNPCPGFGQINPKSRSSSGINSSLQDDAGGIPFNVSICKSLLIRKEGKDASTSDLNDLLGGATFTITPSPNTGSGSLDVLDNDPATGAPDLNSTAGLICVKVAAGTTFSVVEKTAPANYQKDPSTKSGLSPANSDCATRSTASPEATFVNEPLSSIQVIFTSSAGVGKTVSQIVCRDSASTVLDKPSMENGTADVTSGTPNRDDTNETFSGLVQGVYTCTVDIDP